MDDLKITGVTGVAASLKTGARALRLAYRDRRKRQDTIVALRSLDDRMLRDIGICRSNTGAAQPMPSAGRRASTRLVTITIGAGLPGPMFAG